MNSREKKIFRVLVRNGKLNASIGLNFNLEAPTMGGKNCWNTLLEENGHKFQQNKYLSNCRIIDNRNIRLAHGSLEELKKSLENRYTEIIIEALKEKNITGEYSCYFKEIKQNFEVSEDELNFIRESYNIRPKN